MTKNKIKFIFSCFLAIEAMQPLSAPAAEGLRLELSPDSSPPAQAEPLKLFLDEAIAALPPGFRLRLNERIRLRFRNLDGDTPLTPPACGASGTATPSASSELGRFIPWPSPTIELNAKLLPAIAQREAHSATYPCGHRNLYRLAKATLLHELAHAYDSFLNLPGEYSVSTQARFLDLTDWDSPTWHWPAWSQLNHSQARSPDGYELTNPHESFAVNMEFFLLDESFACRRPRMHAFLSGLFRFDPFPQRTCRTDRKMAVQTSFSGSGSLEWKDFDSSRLYQVQYLYATPGSDAVSSFGHSMFRLVFCSPDRAEPGPDCLKDLKHHVIVSFRANVNDSSINPWAGLTGKYPSQLFLLSLEQVRVEYTIAELRDLRAFPLLLNSAQKQAFLERMAEMFWGYRGRYFFVTSNCASESLRLLRGALEDPRLDQSSALTPKGVYELLRQTGWIDNSALRDRARAIELGFLFPSIQDSLKRSFAWIAARQYGSWAEDARYLDPLFRQLLTGSTATSRQSSFRKNLALVPAGERATLAAHYFMLEAYFESRLTVNLQRNAASLLFNDPARIGADSEAAAKLKKELLAQQAADPAGRASGGYGIPLASEVDAASAAAQTSASTKELILSLKALLQKAFPAEFAELDAIARNRTEYAKAFH